MSSALHTVSATDTLAGRVLHDTGVAVAECYQCGKCSAGCPLADEMDITPSQILRMLQLEMPELDDEVLRSHTIWLCLTCEMCYARCPKEIDLPKVMDSLRAESLRRKVAHPKARDIIAFHKSFLDSIRTCGRLYEILLIVAYKVRTRHLLQDLLMAPKLFVRGKLNPIPELIRGRSHMARIFQRAQRKDG
ncbi:4Fe-4S dicluster domain-containing protein [Candidatus Fermentibacteria bacterium]|nr:4Fe-4S dicluster domain-containing protein [Candidatus Fermentibacteria bacterium]